MRLLAAAAILILSAGSAQAFGTINAAKQSAEHEKITRRALGSAFQPKSLEQLAGKPGKFGAVGYPDASGAVFKSQAHCDDGDALGQLDACRAWMKQHLDEAVADAAGLLDGQHRIKASAVRLTPGCVWALGVKGRAKCNVLQAFGVTLHASQDFYSHSNWVDDRSETTPPGLGNVGPAPFMDLRTFPAIPAAVKSGCFSLWGKCGTRIGHAELNKDNGRIGASIGPGITPRGKSHNNFKAAVEAATADTADKWALLRERLAATYGPADGARMICALSHDDPVKACQAA